MAPFLSKQCVPQQTPPTLTHLGVHSQVSGPVLHHVGVIHRQAPNQVHPQVKQELALPGSEQDTVIVILIIQQCCLASVACGG
jgi:hypothetical protein